MIARPLLAVAVGLVVCATGGALAGFDAAGHVDRRYTVPRFERMTLPPMPASSAWDWNEVPPPAAMPATYEVPSRSERAFFHPGYDLGDVDAAVARIEPVRVHRPTKPNPEPVAESPEPVAVPDDTPDDAMPPPEDEAAVTPAG